jgi:hypothetical protein
VSARHIALFANRIGQPSLDLNFLAGSLDQRITFTRAAGPATYFDAAGVLQTAGTNVARFDTDPATLAPRGLLIEEARNNVLTNSQAINSWPTKTDTTITDNNLASPDATTDASRCVEGTATNAAVVSNAATVGAGSVVTGSVHLKRGNATWQRVTVAETGLTNGGRAWVNLVTGALGTVGNIGTGVATTATITSVGNGWYRVAVTTTLAGTTASVFVASAQNDNTVNRVNSAQYYLWGAQIEVGAFPTSYIPTTSAAATRAADVPTSVDTGWLASGAGTAVLTANTLGGVAANVSQAGDGSHANPVASLITATPNAAYRRVRYWPRTLTAQQLQQVTR